MVAVMDRGLGCLDQAISVLFLYIDKDTEIIPNLAIPLNRGSAPPRSVPVKKSNLLRATEYRAVFQLVGECRELAMDSRLWRTHLLAGLCRLAGAKVGICGCSRLMEGTIQPDFATAVDVGWEDAAERERLLEYLREKAARQDVVLAAFGGGRRLPFTLDCPVMTCVRQQSLPAKVRQCCQRTFGGSRGRPCTVHNILSLAPLEEGVMIGITLYREFGARAFNDHQVRLVHFVHCEIAPLLRKELAGPGIDPISGLPPRLRQVLRRLLEGDSEKHAAARLGLAPATLHQYVKALYGRFGVQSRAELSARFIRFPGLLRKSTFIP